MRGLSMGVVMCSMFFIAHVETKNNLQPNLWTWLYQKVFTAAELEKNSVSRQVVMSKTDVPLFSQLMFSWNGFRDKGFYSFWIQVRDNATQKWSNWYKMIEWGDNIQRSFAHLSHDSTKYVHVRLETGVGNLADAFRVKIRAHNGSDLKALKSFAVALSNYALFKSEQVVNGLSLPSVLISSVPRHSQMVLNHTESKRLCSTTASTMLVNYLGSKSVCPECFADKAYDQGLDAYGSWPFNTAHAFECCGGTARFVVARLNSFASLHQRLLKGIPVVVSVRGALPGAPQEYPKGHLMLVIGWDKETQEVICHDPAFEDDQKVFVRYALQPFLDAWERSRRLVYLAQPV